ncbi:MAG: ATP-dependent DNA helicase RecG [Xanthomonadaceae bacterium]|nr:ATP-dependent DNA helicase RecG [Xanthomonadaceae bacterium]
MPADSRKSAPARRIEDLPGIGPGLAAKFRTLGVNDEHNLLFHLPLRYEDRTRLTPISRLRPSLTALVEGRVCHQETRQGGRRSLLVVIEDDTGQVVLRFFNFYPSQQRQFAIGNRLRCFGEVRFGPEGFEMAHPQCQNLRAGHEPIHRPDPGADLEGLINGLHPAVRRLALEELIAHHLALARLNRARARQHAQALCDEAGLVGRLLRAFPFEPTAAQKRVMTEIGADLSGTRPMRRLLQGDVGSGKTLVAAAAAAQAMGAGAQVAIVAPTEILAEQHRVNFSAWFKPLGIEPVWLAGKVTGKKREQTLGELADGAALAIGTHALFQEAVQFRNLCLVIVDEQHRFGVDQRLALAAKGSRDRQVPHQLVMTATPIPRTLAMTAYAGLEISVIDELPPGRKPVTTALIDGERRGQVIERIRIALGEGRQAYWVCPLIEESDALEAEAAETTAAELERQLPGLRVGLIHGRMKSTDKTAVMDAFKQGHIRLLVATTVIEVGVDVSNASLMMIENAERLGLSQLHQLRGRVGRGSEKAACVLLYKSPVGQLARERLKVMRETSDGFRIAERDLELRGPGELLGRRQTGMLRFRIADLGRDAGLIDRVAPLATALDRDQADTLIRRWIGDAEQFADA